MLKTKDGYAKVIGTSYQGSSDYLLLSNGDSKAISSLSVNYATSAGNADTVDGYHASSLVKFYLSPMANDAPADSAKSWFINTMPSASGAIVYNVPGVEKTIIAGKSSGAYGHMLQLNYQDTYLRVLRYYNGSWKSTDWEKISAGYADSAGSVAWDNVTGKPSSYKPSAHTHTVFKNNLMIKGTNGISDSASIHLGIGDSDTGFKWISDGKCQIYANNSAVGEWTSGGMNWFKNPTVNGNKIWNAGNDGSGSGLDADTVDGVHVSQLCRIYTFNVHNSIIKVGTLTSGQQGHVCKLRFNSGIGYNASNQDKAMTVVIRASNGGANSNGFYFEAHSESYRGGAFTTFYLHQTSKTQCELYMAAFNHSGQSTYEVSFSAGDSWTNEISVQNALPTSNIFTLPNYQIAYTDYNIASATKLATARTIWGQSFDGTADISGTLSGVAHIQFSADNTYNIGSNGAASKYIYTYWLGAKSGQKLELGANNSGYGQGLCIDTNLNVGIGTNTPTYKLHVNGTFRATNSTVSDLFVNTGDATLKIYTGITTDTQNDGNICFQTSIDATDGQSHAHPTQYQSRCNIVLQPRGGQVYIGTNPGTGNTTYKLYVNSKIFSNGGFVKNGSSDSYVILGGGGHKLESALSVSLAQQAIGTALYIGIETLQNAGYLASDYTNRYNTEEFCKALSKYLQTNYSGKSIFGTISPNSSGFFTANIYGDGFNSNGNPEHITIHYYPHGGDIINCGTSYGNWYYNSVSKAEHTHSWQSITDKIVEGNEFNIVNAGFNNRMWFNYLPIDNRNGSAAISQYVIGNGNKGLASVYAKRFKVDGQGCMWKDARNYAPFYATFNGGFEPILDIKTVSGDWSIGSYDSAGNSLIFSFTSDSDFNAGVNGTANYWLSAGGEFKINTLRLAGPTTANMGVDSTNPQIIFAEDSTIQQVALTYTDVDTYRASKGLKVHSYDGSDDSNVWFEVQGYNYSSGYVKNGSSNAYVLLGGGGHKPLSEFQLGNGSYLPYNGLWASGSGQDINNANGMIFAYANHKNSPFSSDWGIITTFDFTYNSDYKFQLAANGYSNAMYYRSRSYDRGGWTSWAQVIDTGNIGSQRVSYATSAGNADTVDGYHVSSNNDKPWSTIPVIATGGWMDIGKQLEFHFDNTTGSDFSTLLRCTGNYSNVVTLPSGSGTLALTSDNVASATKLQTPRTIWGQSFDGTGNVDGELVVNGDNVVCGIKINSNISESSISFNGANGGYRWVTGRYADRYFIWNDSYGEVFSISNNTNVGIGTTSPAYKLDVNGQVKASGFHHGSINSDNYILLAGGGYKSYGGSASNPIFLGYLNLYHGNDGTIDSYFYCLGYSVSFTYTRGGNYCKISIPNTTHQVFFIKAAIASVNYSGGGIDNWTGEHRGDGAWWLHCYASGNNDVRVKGFRNSNGDNDSWWGGNPLYSGSGSANVITVCLFGYVDFR